MTTRHGGRARKIALVGAAALTLVLGACGDGDGGDGQAADSDVEAYCDAELAVETIGEPDIDFENASEAEQQAAAKAFANDELLPKAKAVQDAAPDDIKADVDTLVAAVEDAAETGDFAAFEDDEEIEEAEANLHEFDLENCGWTGVDVEAVDYAFEGLDDSYDAGVTSFDFSNGGKEVHEMIVVKKKNGVSESFDDILAMEDQAAQQQKVDFMGAAFGPPGDESYFVVDLEPGSYIALCFVPEGTTPEVMEQMESSGEEPENAGPPHFVKGMKKEFTVS
jgi:hypothetical protein